MNRSGMTMIELLIALTIAAIVAAAGFRFYENTFAFSVTTTRTSQMQRNLRLALDMITRDIRGAGYGVVDPLTTVVQSAVAPIQAGNNADPDAAGTANRLDRITLIGGYLPVGTLSAAPAAGATQITLTFAPGADPANLHNQTFTIEGFYYGTATRVGLTTTFNVAPALNRAFLTGDAVTVVQTITYTVAVPAAGAEPALFRNDGTGAQMVASGIEDLQFAYLMADGTESNGPAAVAPPALPAIRAVRVSLIARGQDPRRTAAQVSTRPAVEDHAAGAGPDQFHRRLLTKVVEVRNFGF